jgi:hypothetical protein
LTGPEQSKSNLEAVLVCFFCKSKISMSINVSKERINASDRVRAMVAKASLAHEHAHAPLIS